METANLTKKEFRVVITQIIKNLGEEWMQSWEGKSFNKELENIKNNQNQVKEYYNWNKNTLEGINCRLNDTEGMDPASWNTE